MVGQIYKSYENYSCAVYKCQEADITLFLCLPQYMEDLTQVIMCFIEFIKQDGE